MDNSVVWVHGIGPTRFHAQTNVLVDITEELSPNVRMIPKTLLNALLDGTVEVDRCPVCKVSQKQSTDFLPQGWRFALRSPQ